MRRRDVTNIILAAAGATSFLPSTAHAQTTLPQRYPRTSAEKAAGIVPVNESYPYGTPERYGAVGDGHTDDTIAFRNMIRSNVGMTFTPGKIYGVTSITFPIGTHYVVNFNGAKLRGLATSPTPCIVHIETEGSTFIAYDVDINFNKMYTCGTWWYNSSASSQYNSIFGMKHSYGVRGMVYGALPGNTSTKYAQSENSVYGWRTRGIQNPFYGNHRNGFLFFSEPIFVAHDEEWTHSRDFNWPQARAFENHQGTVHSDGGEIQMSGSSKSTYAADLANCEFQGAVIETNVPLRVVGNSVNFNGGRALCLVDRQPQFVIQRSLRGQLVLNDMRLIRPAGLGTYSSEPLVDARAAEPTFQVILNNCMTQEWRWSQISGDAKLVRGGTPRYRGHRLKITASDPYTYVLDTSPGACSFTNSRDRYGYDLSGWHGHHDPASILDFKTAATSHPPGYLPTHFSLYCNRRGIADNLDDRTLSSIQRTALQVHPGDLFLVQTWIIIVSGNDVRLVGRYYDTNGDFIKETTLADHGAISRSWNYLQALVATPSRAAYMGLGISVNSSTAEWTDFCVTRAS